MEVIDEMWLNFVDHLLTGVRLASHASIYVAKCMSCFKIVSHPYIVCGAEEDRLIVTTLSHL